MYFVYYTIAVGFTMLYIGHGETSKKPYLHTRIADKIWHLRKRATTCRGITTADRI